MKNTRILSDKEIMNEIRNLEGGSSSDYSLSFHANSMNNASLSQYTLKNINQTPLFNPFNINSNFATPTNGITPTGAYYMNTLHGGNKKNNPWITHVKHCQNKYGLSYKDAMCDPRTKQSYKLL
jgi:hypothetical protein